MKWGFFFILGTFRRKVPFLFANHRNHYIFAGINEKY